MNKKKVVLFFDTWIVGTKFTFKIAEYLKETYDVYYLSMDDMICKTSKSIGTVITDFKKNDLEKYKDSYNAVYDFSFFENSFDKVFNKLKPDVLITISLHGFEHRYINEIASYKNIPCVMFMHGIRSMETNTTQSLKLKKIFHYLSRTVYFTKVFTFYLADLKKVSNKTFEFAPTVKRYFNLILRHSKFTNTPNSDEGLSYHTIHVLNEIDKDYYKKNYGLSSSTNYKVIFHPDVIEVLDRLKTKSNENISKSDIALFVSQPFSSAGMLSFDDYEKTVLYAKQISEYLNLELVIRTHPRDDFEFIDLICKKYKIRKSTNDLFIDIAVPKLFFGFNSTFFLQVKEFGCPILFFNLPSLGLPSFYKKYEKAIIVTELSKMDISKIAEQLLSYINEGDIVNKNNLAKKDPRYSISDTLKNILCQD